MHRRTIIAGLAFAGALIIGYLVILFGTALIPGTPFHDAQRLAPAMADNPTNAQIKSWFENAEALVFFGSIIVPAIVGLLGGLGRLVITMDHIAYVIAAACWVIFFTLFAGVGAQETVGILLFLGLLTMFEYVARRRHARAVAA